MDGEGDQSTFVEYTARFAALNKVLNQYKSRKSEHGLRDDAMVTARVKLQKVHEKVEDLAKKKPWITEEQKKDVEDSLTETRQWLQTMSEQ